MLASRRTRRVVHHEWTLTQPVHYTDLLQAVDVATSQRDRETLRTTELMVTTEDDLIVIGYTVDATS